MGEGVSLFTPRTVGMRETSSQLSGTSNGEDSITVWMYLTSSQVAERMDQATRFTYMEANCVRLDVGSTSTVHTKAKANLCKWHCSCLAPTNTSMKDIHFFGDAVKHIPTKHKHSLQISLTNNHLRKPANTQTVPGSDM